MRIGLNVGYEREPIHVFSTKYDPLLNVTSLRLYKGEHFVKCCAR